MVGGEAADASSCEMEAAAAGSLSLDLLEVDLVGNGRVIEEETTGGRGKDRRRQCLGNGRSGTESTSTDLVEAGSGGR